MNIVRIVAGLLVLTCSIVSGYAEEVASSYYGMVKSVRGVDLVIIQKDGHEKSMKLSKETRVFASGRVVPYTRLKPNSVVRVAVIDGSKCIQVVVEEGPK